jgi:hypothetical protein
VEFGRVNEIVYKSFSVTDQKKDLVTGLIDSDFSRDLYDPVGNEISDTIVVTITELSSGHYRASFTPSMSGDYFLSVYHQTYFPWGKTGTIKIYNENFDSLGESQSLVLGLVHQNIYIDNTTYDINNNLVGARVRIYSNPSSVGTTNDVIGIYEIASISEGPGKFKTWRQIKL